MNPSSGLKKSRLNVKKAPIAIHHNIIVLWLLKLLEKHQQFLFPEREEKLCAYLVCK